MVYQFAPYTFEGQAERSDHIKRMLDQVLCQPRRQDLEAKLTELQISNVKIKTDETKGVLILDGYNPFLGVLHRECRLN